MKKGRPSTYRPELHNKLAEVLGRYGKTDEEIAKDIGISHPTFIQWKKKYPDFNKALKKGKGRISAVLKEGDV